MTNLKKQYLSSSLWVIIGRGSSNAMSFLVFVVIARYLVPAQFGQVAFAAVFTDLTRALALAGIPQAMVRSSDWEQRRASTAFWLNLGLAIALAIVVGGGFGTGFEWYFGGGFGLIIASLSATFVIESSSSIHEAKLQKEFGYRSLANRLLIGTLIGGVVGIAMAVSGFGVWALVGNRLANSIAQALLLWATVKWRPSWTYDKDEARPLLSYAFHLGGSAVIGKLNNRIPDLFLGVIANLTAVGLYRVGSRAVFMIQDAVIAPLQNTTLTTLSRANERNALASAYTRIVMACGLLAFPVYGGAALIATDFTVLVFGPQWHLAGQVMTALALAGAASALLSFTPPTLVAVGWTRFVLINNVSTFVIALVLTVILARWGAVAVAWGYCLRAYLSVPLSLVLLGRATDIDAVKVIKGLAPSFISASLMVGGLFLVQENLMTEVTPILRLLAMVAGGVLLYPAFLMIFGRKLVLDLWREASHLLPIRKGKA
ncbi:oligosaccharide flippase family protein [Novosphingobium sp. B1]|uniref:oligosaccharide flippase family protein n=1 Tax=Novosphingobium sp. B1 TaxID=1938756 RepID=UPI0009D7FF5C|nr:oligosaccharide flippase family protein [Novosphingobium sp. B1]SMD00941.1 Membrane protein involved in the export of O-antigen and teichoic acid [Novosphingobium sp. B1]